ncbi:MAG: phosphoenolpyruvate--protein phosphotransferase [Chloroflexota bacterium]|nr:MAG: phosphoenolpyruvate--protein phosphotransferase [Chloroflexota bacterium]
MASQTPEIQLQGIPASEGIAIGPAYCFTPQKLVIPTRCAEGFEQEMGRFADACAAARLELQSLREAVSQRANEEQAAIFDAHQEMLADPMLEEKVSELLGQGMIVEQAVLDAAEELAALLAGLDDELFVARAADVKDVGRRVLRIMLGLPDASLDGLTAPSIIIAQDLTPSDTANLDPQLTLGFCTVSGGLTSHSAILARSLGIPAVVGLGDALLKDARNGVLLAMDGSQGMLLLSPEQSTIERFRLTKELRERRLNEMKATTHQLARTANGRRVEVAANIGEVESAHEAVENGAEGVGLLRTEFLYLNEVHPPTEEKQYTVYRAIFEAIGERPVIVRTLDIGGDKPPSYIPFANEMNPFLGWRAIRICLDDICMFKTQLRAILRAAVGHDVRIMFPMIGGLDELCNARGVLDEAQAELIEEGLPFAKNIPVGIMVETPAAAMLVDVLCEASDFFSLGTNDLTQYTLAVDRGNPQVAELYQPLHPAVLRLIRQTIEGAHARGRWVGMCGELAGMEKAIPILLGLGLDEFSMAPRLIPRAKHLIGRISDEQATAIATQALSLSTAHEIEDYMQEVQAKFSD